MRTLLVDNHDSYTFNLFQLIAAVNGVDPVVVRNDDARWSRLDLNDFDNVVISPGPGRPQSARDRGHVLELLEKLDHSSLPVLGVCLGHQLIAYAAGGDVVEAPEPRHGHLTRVRHTGVELFAGIPGDFTAVRYHSLCVADPMPVDLEPTAWAEDGVVMALRHRRLPRWGVQFHPESIATEHGRRLMENYRQLSSKTLAGGRRQGNRISGRRRDPTPPIGARPRSGRRPRPDGLGLSVVRLTAAIDCEQAFHRLYRARQPAFWLDSSRVEPALSRFSFLGDGDGPLSEILSYRIREGAVRVTPRWARPYRVRQSIFDILDERLERLHLPAGELPFGLGCGYVGYFGYELKAECGAPGRHRAETPDAVWLLADRVIAVDHVGGQTYLLGLHDGSPEIRRRQEEWLCRTATVLASPHPQATADQRPVGPPVDVAACLTRGRDRYLVDIGRCLRALRAGESYEVCLTNQARVPAPADDLGFYQCLRRLNPAPYAALLRFPDVSIFSSSPERFLRISRDGTVESRPIKGTAPRSPDPLIDAQLRADLGASAKNRAENLMIVDLVRNDLGRVCEIGSVSVPAFMATESYATVHHLVSTVTGRLRAYISSVQCAKACFPGGSMTGAPKLRTMEILDSLETEARGVYSGALGYFGLGGEADLSIVIRTCVRWREHLMVGAGGAIVLDSDPTAEFDEMLLKAEASLSPLASHRVALR